MIISAKELIGVLEGAYDLEREAALINKSVAATLTGYAEANNLSKNAIKQAYKSFKSFKEGKVNSQDEDYFTLQAIVEQHFSATEDDNTEDSVSV